MPRLFVPIQFQKVPRSGAWSRLAAILPMLEGVTLPDRDQDRPGVGDLVWTTLAQASPWRSNQIVDVSGDELIRAGPLRRLLLRRCLRKAVHVVVETDALQRELVACGCVESSRLTLIPLRRDGSTVDAARAYSDLFKRLGTTVSLRDRDPETRPIRRAARIGLSPLPAE